MADMKISANRLTLAMENRKWDDFSKEAVRCDDRQPSPGDGPDFWADFAAWRQRQTERAAARPNGDAK